jgi:exonuclease SbcD
MLSSHPPAGRAVFVGHAFVQGGKGSDSERPLSVGGAGTVAASHFSPFCYAALGHLHRPQTVTNEKIRYAGALLKYSFDEVGQDRSVNIVDIDASGRCSVDVIVLRPRRDLRRIEGTLEELLRSADEPCRGLASGGPSDSSKDDYIVARLTDPHPVLDPIGRLRKIYPNVLCIERAPALGEPGELQPSRDRRGLDHGELFAGFFKEMTGQPPTAEQQEVFRSVDASIAGRDREVPA